MSQINNKDLEQAIALTGNILDNDEHESDSLQDSGDLHSENIMIRLTGNIPQLVIADPILTW